ncbi:hypothetical protein SVAN01_07019 [Stagonosporopsis vannaccii]|nr:hypothetical protein SVAN01_07019 [Stagonosporopsis vannaccii]
MTVRLCALDLVYCPASPSLSPSSLMEVTICEAYCTGKGWTSHSLTRLPAWCYRTIVRTSPGLTVPWVEGAHILTVTSNPAIPGHACMSEDCVLDVWNAIYIFSQWVLEGENRRLDSTLLQSKKKTRRDAGLPGEGEGGECSVFEPVVAGYGHSGDAWPRHRAVYWGATVETPRDASNRISQSCGRSLDMHFGGSENPRATVRGAWWAGMGAVTPLPLPIMSPFRNLESKTSIQVNGVCPARYRLVDLRESEAEKASVTKRSAGSWVASTIFLPESVETGCQNGRHATTRKQKELMLARKGQANSVVGQNGILCRPRWVSGSGDDPGSTSLHDSRVARLEGTRSRRSLFGCIMELCCGRLPFLCLSASDQDSHGKVGGCEPAQGMGDGTLADMLGLEAQRKRALAAAAAPGHAAGTTVAVASSSLKAQCCYVADCLAWGRRSTQGRVIGQSSGRAGLADPRLRTSRLRVLEAASPGDGEPRAVQLRGRCQAICSDHGQRRSRVAMRRTLRARSCVTAVHEFTLCARAADDHGRPRSRAAFQSGGRRGCCLLSSGAGRRQQPSNVHVAGVWRTQLADNRGESVSAASINDDRQLSRKQTRAGAPCLLRLQESACPAHIAPLGLAAPHRANPNSSEHWREPPGATRRPLCGHGSARSPCSVLELVLVLVLELELKLALALALHAARCELGATALTPLLRFNALRVAVPGRSVTAAAPSKADRHGRWSHGLQLAEHGAVVGVESAQQASLSRVDRLKGQNPRTRRDWRRTSPAGLPHVQSLPFTA